MLTHEFAEAATFTNMNAALDAAEVACAHTDAVLCPVKEAGVWVVQAQDFADGASFGFLAR